MDSRWEGISSDEFSDYVDENSTHSDTEVGRMKPTRKRKMGEQATPHKVIEKRRRDRINRSLDELRVMVPAARKAQGVKNDKVDLLQMTIEYLKSLQQPVPKQQNRDCDKIHHDSEKENDENNPAGPLVRHSSEKTKHIEHDLSPNDVMLAGFKECAEEAIRFLIEVEHLSPDDPLVLRLSAHLKKLQNNLEFNTAMEEHTKIFSFVGRDYPLIQPHDFLKKSYQGPVHASLPTPQSSPPQRTLPATTLGELRIDTTPHCTMASGMSLPPRVPIPPIAAPPQQVNGVISPASSTNSGMSPSSLTPMYAYVPRYAAYAVMPHQMYVSSPPLVSSPVSHHSHSPPVMAVGSAATSNHHHHQPYMMTWLPPNSQ